MRKFVIGAVASASLLGGSLAIAAVNPLGIAGAQDPPATSPPGTAPEAPRGPGGDKGAHKGGGGALSETLKELVANNTITQQQADAITSSLEQKMKARGEGGGKGERGGKGGHGGPGRGGVEGKKQFGETAAGAIGIDVATLRTELEGGKSIAEVAQARGVDPQKVIDAIVAKATADIDQAVADGKIPAERAADIKSKLGTRIAEMVNGHRDGRPPR